jgi:hypothetical protein
MLAVRVPDHRRRLGIERLDREVSGRWRRGRLVVWSRGRARLRLRRDVLAGIALLLLLLLLLLP